jgi:hypothetical protein
MKIGLGIGLVTKTLGGGVIPPAISLVTISGTAVVGQTLTASASGVTGVPTPTLSYQWKRGATNIGTNADTYTLVQADAGQSITCVVTATNAGGSANATSNALAIIDTIVQKSGSASAAAYDINMVLNSSYANYSTQIVRVRRSGDNAEANYGVASNGYVDWSAITTWVNSGGGTQNGFVVTIYDQSGNGRNFTQSTPAAQMQIIASGVLLTDTGVGSGAVARAAMKATGTQFYEIAASTAMFNFLHNGGDGWITSVQRFGSVADPNARYTLIGNANAASANIGVNVGYMDLVAGSFNNATELAVYRGVLGASAAISIVNNTLLPNQVSIVNWQLDADNATALNRTAAWTNNGSISQINVLTNAPSTSNSTTNMQWGASGNGSNALVGSFQRLIIWNANLSIQITTITDLTNSYYGAY